MNAFVRRGWWKPWNWLTRTWILVIAVSAFVSPLMTRWICLWQVPDVTLPFNVEDVIQDDVPKEQDAIVRYTAALLLFGQQELILLSEDRPFKDRQDLDKSIDRAVQQDNPQWDDRLDHWLLSQSKAFEEFRRGSEMERAGGPSLKTADYDLIVNEHQHLRTLARLGGVEAVRLERSGELDAAWGLHLDLLRCARHCKMPRYVICYLIGSGVRQFAYRGIVRWAEHSSLTVEQLQNARNELSIDQTTMVPTSEIIKANYLCFRNFAARVDSANYLFPAWNTSGPFEPYLFSGKRTALWTVGQPDILLRLSRQILLNVSDQIDLPLHQRRKSLRSGLEVIFEPDQNKPRQRGQLDSRRLNVLHESCYTKNQNSNSYLIGSGLMDQINRRESAGRVSLDIVLASHQYQRVHGEFPSSIERLIPVFLDSMPFDPMDAVGAPPHFRREENGEVTVWSNGYNEVDDGGEITEDNGLDYGYRIRLKQSVSQ